MGMIDKDATLKAIADYLRDNLADCNYYYLHGAQDVAEVVENMPERGGWILCSERLPENDDKVLCCTATKKGTRNIVIGYYIAERKYWACGMNSNVIAWQPLPECYKGGFAAE